MVKSIAVVPALAATVLGAALPQWGSSPWGGDSTWSSPSAVSSGSSNPWSGFGGYDSGSTGSSGYGSSSDSASAPASSSVSSGSTSTSSSSGSASSSSGSGSGATPAEDASSSSGTSRTTAPSGAITVCSSGCDYSTIQDAVDSLDGSSDASIFISAGTYSEQVTIPSRSGALTIYGETEDTSDYAGNTVSIEHSSSLASGAADDEHTGTLIIESDNVAVYNVDVKNTYGQGSQAIALSAYGTNQGYYGVGLYGYQDTLLAETGNQVYARCYIEGAVDFIFGQYARIWVVGSTLASVGPGAITANGRASDDDDGSYYVVTDSTVRAGDGADPGAGAVYLGRPWAAYARVAFQRTSLSDVVNAAGWEAWSSSEPNTEGAVFEEYDNTGDGAAAAGDRAAFATTLDAAVAIDTILGADYADWVDAAYL